MLGKNSKNYKIRAKKRTQVCRCFKCFYPKLTEMEEESFPPIPHFLKLVDWDFLESSRYVVSSAILVITIRGIFIPQASRQSDLFGPLFKNGLSRSTIRYSPYIKVFHDVSHFFDLISLRFVNLQILYQNTFSP